VRVLASLLTLQLLLHVVICEDSTVSLSPTASPTASPTSLAAVGSGWPCVNDDSCKEDLVCGDIKQCEEEAANPLGLFLGSFFKLMGSTVVTLGQIFQRLAQLKEEEKPVEERASSFLKLWRWWFGLLLIASGAIGDVIALNFAPQSVIMPIGSGSLVMNLFFAHLLLHENVTKKDYVGTGVIIVGAIGVAIAYSVIGEEKPEVEYTGDDMVQLFMEPAMIIYLCSLAVMLVYMRHYAKVSVRVLTEEGPSSSAYLKRKFKQALCYATSSGIWGSMTVTFTACVIKLVSVSFEGENQFLKPVPYLLLVCMLTCIFMQIGTLTQGLQHFGALWMIPIFTCMYTIFAIMGGSIYFGDLDAFTAPQWALFLFSVGLTLVGVLLLAGKSDEGDDDEEDGPADLEVGKASAANETAGGIVNIAGPPIMPESSNVPTLPKINRPKPRRSTIMQVTSHLNAVFDVKHDLEVLNPSSDGVPGSVKERPTLSRAQTSSNLGGGFPGTAGAARRKTNMRRVSHVGGVGALALNFKDHKIAPGMDSIGE